MTRIPAVSRLFVLALFSATLGCQTTHGLNRTAVVTPKEQPVQAAAAAPVAQAPVVSLKEQKDKTSYSVGLQLGQDLQLQEMGLSVEPLLQGIRDSLLGNKPLLSQDELDAVRQAFLKERQSVRAEALGLEAEKMLVAGEAFLQANAKKEGVKSRPSGLQYRVIKPGAGPTPLPKDNVKIHYVVKTLEGKELVSTYQVGRPSVVPVKGMLPAWTEALQLMKVGEKWEIFAPSYLAYGERGADEVVQPFQALIFELELVEILYPDPH